MNFCYTHTVFTFLFILRSLKPQWTRRFYMRKLKSNSDHKRIGSLFEIYAIHPFIWYVSWNLNSNSLISLICAIYKEINIIDYHFSIFWNVNNEVEIHKLTERLWTIVSCGNVISWWIIPVLEFYLVGLAACKQWSMSFEKKERESDSCTDQTSKKRELVKKCISEK